MYIHIYKPTYCIYVVSYFFKEHFFKCKKALNIIKIKIRKSIFFSTVLGVKIE